MVGRRRTRAKQKAFHLSDSSELDASTDEDADVGVPQASTRKARGKQKAVAKSSGVRITKKGKLGMIAEMPLDVLYEIFTFLAPRDLIRMSWTNKGFRRVLTSRSTRNIWKAALESVDELPPCPPFMNEIEYSTLLFHVACYGCGRARPPVNWYFRRRICKRCLPDQVYTGEQMWEKVLDADIEDALSTVRLGDSLELGTFLSYDLLKVEPGRNGKMFVTLRDDVHDFIDECRKDLDAGKDLYNVVREYEARRHAGRAHMKAITPWEEGQAFDREDALDSERTRRFQQILERLEDEGWGYELNTHPQFYSDLGDQPGVKISKTLTDRGWKNIRGSLLGYLVKARESRLEEERLKKKSGRTDILRRSMRAFHRSNMTPQEFFPTPDVIENLPHIAEILDGDDDEAFEELNKDIAEQLPGITDQVRREREETLLKLLPPGYTSPEPLKLATTWFSHSLLSWVTRAEDVINQMWDTAGTRRNSVALNRTFEKKAMVAITKLIVDLGVGDPEKMTAEELDSVPCRVVIFTKRPREPVLNMEVGNWRHLVRRLVDHEREITGWRVLEDHELPDVTSARQPFSDLWDCVHCWRAGQDSTGEPTEIQEHLLNAHKIEDPTKDTDYWLERDNGQADFEVNTQPEEQARSPSPTATTPHAE